MDRFSYGIGNPLDHTFYAYADWKDMFESLDDEQINLLESAEWGHDTEKLIGLSRLPWVNKPHRTVPAVDYGQITTRHPKKEQEGLANLHQDMIYRDRKGNPALVQYDPRTDQARMTMLTPDQRRIQWQQDIGRISLPSPNVPKRVRDQRIEDLIRQLVSRVTRQTFQPHRASAGRTDLVPRPQGTRTALTLRSNLATSPDRPHHRVQRMHYGPTRPRSFDEFL